jgi:hypothetical protein
MILNAVLYDIRTYDDFGRNRKWFSHVCSQVGLAYRGLLLHDERSQALIPYNEISQVEQHCLIHHVSEKLKAKACESPVGWAGPYKIHV